MSSKSLMFCVFWRRRRRREVGFFESSFLGRVQSRDERKEEREEITNAKDGGFWIHETKHHLHVGRIDADRPDGVDQVQDVSFFKMSKRRNDKMMM